MSGISKTGSADESMCTSSGTQFHFNGFTSLCVLSFLFVLSLIPRWPFVKLMHKQDQGAGVD